MDSGHIIIALNGTPIDLKILYIQQNIPTFKDMKKSQVTHLIILYINKYYDIYVNTSQII